MGRVPQGKEIAMSEHPHYVVVWVEIDEAGEEQTHVEVYHDKETARQRWASLDDAGQGTLITSHTAPPSLALQRD